MHQKLGSEIDLVRAASLGGFNKLCENHQVSYHDLLDKVGLSENELQQPELFIKYIQVIKLLNQTSIITNCDTIGIELGAQQGISLFGTIGYVLENSFLVGDALAKLQTYYHVHQTSADINLETEGSLAKLSFTITLDTDLSIVQATDLAVIVGVNVLNKLTNGNIQFKHVELQHGYTKNADVYRKIFGVRPDFNCSASTLIFDKKYLALQVEKADPNLLEILSNQFSHIDLNFIDEIPTYVEKIIRQQLNNQIVSIHDIAQKMAMSTRTLQRYLKNQDTSFRIIVDQVRSKIAQQYLVNSSLSLNNISDILQYNNYSEFTRAFKRINGLPPRTFRVKNSPRQHLSRPLRR